ncbi:GPI2-domain-containing protein [Meira miltonrushii]|uniref:GPI2-domain-containing protein n=1 Tax=Meira miltonrushii TaxID=1280837 RepID=A0A316VKQ1_9BASI|nr:GPI2-domain-containing protein [Meira miltonrushii]PWN38127.1 GPI2-domain-containing protein [Meira miltonrushii]
MTEEQQTGSNEGLQPWQRILWSQQPYTDNYVPPDFLGELRTKPTTALPNLTDLMLWSLPLSQHVCIILTFVGLFLSLRDDLIGSESLAICSALTIALCGATMPITSIYSESMTELHTKTESKEKSKKHTNRALAQPLSYALLGLVVLALSPLLRTLTEATTSDSIAALSTTLFLFSFALADFGVGEDARINERPSDQDKASHKHSRNGSSGQPVPLPHLAQGPLPATLSLNASLCASIVLASRLASPIDAFSLILAAIALFAFVSRWLKHHLRRRAPTHWRSAICATVFLLSISIGLLARFSITAAFANVATAVFLSVICPAWMRKAQGWKQARRGPWDMGIPRLRSR